MANGIVNLLYPYHLVGGIKREKKNVKKKKTRIKKNGKD